MRSSLVPCLGALAAFSVAAAAQPQLVWVKQFGTTANDRALALAPDGAGGLFATGWTQGNLGGPKQGGTDAWLARHDGLGNQLWIIQFGFRETESHAAALAADGAGGAFVAGAFATAVAPDPLSWIARYDADGSLLWFGGAPVGSAYALAADEAGGCFLAGHNLGVFPMQAAFIARYDGDGKQLWLSNWKSIWTGGFSESKATSLALDGAGGVFVAGQTEGNAWLARADGAGNQLWLANTGLSNSAVAPDGNPIGGGAFVAGGNPWLARYTPLGSPLLKVQVPASSALAADGAGGVFVAGSSWVGRYDHVGKELWLTQFGTGANAATALSGHPSGDFLMAGYTFGSFGGPNLGGSDVFLARFSDQPPCYPDCDGNSALNIDDFLCFQLQFALNDPYADCDGNSLLNIDDFICFQLAFALGC